MQDLQKKVGESDQPYANSILVVYTFFAFMKSEPVYFLVGGDTQ